MYNLNLNISEIQFQILIAAKKKRDAEDLEIGQPPKQWTGCYQIDASDEKKALDKYCNIHKSEFYELVELGLMRIKVEMPSDEEHFHITEIGIMILKQL